MNKFQGPDFHFYFLPASLSTQFRLPARRTLAK